MGYVALSYDDHLAARTYYEASLTLSRQAQDKQALANALTYLGICAYCLGDYVQARLAYAEGLALRREVGDLPGVRHSLNMSALCAIEQGDDEAAVVWLQECLALAETLTEKAGIAMALRNLGWLALWQGDLAAARRWINESLTVGQSVGDKIVPVRLASWSLAEIDLAEGNYAEASAFAEKWLHVWGDTLDREDRGDALRLAGFAALGGQGDYAAAHRCFEECLVLRQNIGHLPDMAQAWLDLGYGTLKRGDLVQAARYYADSLRLAHRCNHRRRIAFALRALAALARQQGQPVRAARLLGASETADTTLTARLRSLPLLMQQDWTDDQRILQTQLGEASFIAAQIEGQAMSLEQAIAYALSDFEPK
jgi:tetratricopeptide (TPR) repeat protein